MGWASGSSVACAIAMLAKKHVPEAGKPAFYKGMVNALMDQDWDTLEEAEGIDPALDKVLRKVYEE